MALSRTYLSEWRVEHINPITITFRYQGIITRPIGMIIPPEYVYGRDSKYIPNIYQLDTYARYLEARRQRKKLIQELKAGKPQEYKKIKTVGSEVLVSYGMGGIKYYGQSSHNNTIT